MKKMPFEGKYKLTKSENLTKLMMSLGDGGSEEEVRAFSHMDMILEFKQEGDKYSYIINSAKGSKTVTFELGKEFSENLLGNIWTKSVASFEGNDLIIKSKSTNGVELIRHYEILPDVINAELVTSNNMKAKRIYTRVY